MAGGVELATAYISLSASTRGLGNQINRAMGAPEIVKAGDTAGKGIVSRLGGVLKKGAIGVGAAAGGVLATSLFKGWNRLTNIENATAKLTGLGHSAKTVRAIMDDALKSVKGTAFGLDEAATTAAGAVASGIKPGKQLTRTLKLVGDAATIGGTSMAEMGAIFNKVAASNKIQGEVIAQLSDRGIPILQLLAKQLGTTVEDVLDLSKKGKISFEDFQKAMEKGLAGAALKSGETTQGAFKNMGAAAGRFGATLLKGVFPIAKTVFGGIGSMFDKLGEKVGPFVERFSLAIQGIFTLLGKGDYTNALSKSLGLEEDSALIGRFFDLRDAVKDFVSGIKGTFTPQMIYGGNGQAIVKPLDGMVAAGDKVRSMFEKARGAFKNFWDGLTGADPGMIYGGDGKAIAAPLEGFAKVGAKVRDLLDKMKETAQKLWPSIVLIGDALAEAGKALGVSAWQLLLTALDLAVAALTALQPWLDKLAAWLKDNPDKVQALAVGFVAYTAAVRVASVATTVLSGAMKVLNAILRLNPIALVVAGLAALAYWFVETQGKGDTFKDKLLDIWNQVQGKIQVVIDWFKGFWSENGAAILAEWDGIWTQIKDTFESVWNSVRDIAVSVGGWLQTFWQEWGARLGGFFKAQWDNIKTIFSGALDIIKGVFEVFAGLFTADWGRMWDGLVKIAKGIEKALAGAVGFVLENVGLVLELAWAGIKSVAEKAWNGIVDATAAILGGMLGAITGPINRVMQFIQENFIDKINGLFEFLHLGIKISPIWTDNTPAYSSSGRRSGRNQRLGMGGGDRGTPMGGPTSVAASMSKKYVSPVGRPPSFPWGRYPSGGRHAAYDYATPVGTPVRAPYGASVIAAGWDSTGFGNHVRTMDADGRYSIFGHLSSIGVSVGQRLAPGQILGRSGNSGNSTGPHLHWERRTSPYAPGTAFNPDGSGAPGSGGNFFTDFLANVVRGGIDGFVSLTKSGLSSLGFWGDVFGGVLKSLGNGAANFAVRMLGMDAGGQNRPEIKPLLFDSGGVLPTGISVVKNATGRPEPLRRVDGESRHSLSDWDVERLAVAMSKIRPVTTVSAGSFDRAMGGARA